jgi:multimeric flavodoxin WrbA
MSLFIVCVSTECLIVTECPITDDVRNVQKKTWNAEILLLCVPTYGGLPPALWVAFNQRSQGILEKPPKNKLEKYVVSALVLASPHWSGIGEHTPSIVVDQIKKYGEKNS